VLNAIPERNVFHQVQRAFDFVHGFLAPQPFGIANREWRAAFPRRVKIAGCRRVDGMQSHIISGKPRGEFAPDIAGAVIEMPARAKEFDGGYSGTRGFTDECGRQFVIYEKVCGKDSLHGHGFVGLVV
jgi:hypothetical protein